MKKNTYNRKLFKTILSLAVVLSFFLVFFFFQKQKTTINGLFYLINTHADEPIDGLLKWEKELDNRKITAMIKVSKPVCEKYPELFKRLSQKGHELILSNPDSCWDVPYKEQYRVIKEEKIYLEKLTGQTPRVMACKYSSYDENTVKVAQELGIPYVLARGTEDVRAMIYKPEEYDVSLIEVSNVEFGEMGKGSLCDISLFARGSTAEDFNQVFEESLLKSPDSMILVSHPHIGGIKKAYWEVYEKSLESKKVTWCSFDQWLKKLKVKEMPYDQIPVNREVKYLKPNPVVPLDQLENLEDFGDKLVMFHNGRGPMCIEAKEFLSSMDYPVEEHLNNEAEFATLLAGYKTKFKTSRGVSDSFSYYPIIFIGNQAFSGFNDEIKNEILTIMNGQ